MKRPIMEYMGTFFFVLTIAMTGNPFAIAAMLMAWVYIGGYVSGGHYNPMVSLALAIRGTLQWKRLPSYIIAQTLGGCSAFAMTYFLKKSFVMPHPGVGVDVMQAFIVEILLAFVLAFVVLTVATAENFRGSQVFGFAIGFTIPALAVMGGPISGGLFNPAIALGSMFVGIVLGTPIIWAHVVLYVVGAFIGGALAAYAFNFFMCKDNKCL